MCDSHQFTPTVQKVYQEDHQMIKTKQLDTDIVENKRNILEFVLKYNCIIKFT